LEKEGLSTHVEEFTVNKDGKTALRAVVLNNKLDGLLNGEKPAGNAAPHNSKSPPIAAGHQPRYALTFPEETSRVEVTSNFNLVEDFTIEAWVTVGDVSSTEQLYYNQGIIDFDSQFGMTLWHGPGERRDYATISRLDPAYQFSITQNSRDQKSVDRGQRSHIATVFEKGEVRQYVDGKQSLTTNRFPVQDQPQSAKSMIVTKMTIGNGKAKNVGPFRGFIEGVRYSKGVRYSAEFTPPVDLTKDEKTFALYRFEEGSGATLKDSSGNGHDGIIKGAKWVNSDNETAHIESKSVPTNYALSPVGDLKKKGQVAELPKFLKIDDEMTIEATITPFSHGADRESRPIISIAGRLELKQYGDRLTWTVLNTEANPVSESTYLMNLPLGKPLRVAAVSTGKQLRLFVEGKLVDSHDLKTLPASPANNIQFAHWGVDAESYRHFDGTIDELRFSNFARYDSDYTPTVRLGTDEQTIALYHCDEGAGKLLNDSSGNGHDAGFIAARWVNVDSQPVPPNYSLSPGGDPTQKGRIAKLPKFIKIDDPMTIEMTITPFSHGTSDESRSLLSFAGRLELKQYNEQLVWQRNNPGAALPAEYTPLVKLPLHKPLRLAAVSTGKQLRLFVEGKLIGTHDLAVLPSSPSDLINLVAWAGDTGGYKPFDGTIDEIRFSNFARYNAEYTPTKTLTTDKNTVALYHCDEGSGDTLIDSSGNGHDAELLEAKWMDPEGEPVSPNLALSPAGDFEAAGNMAVFKDLLEVDDEMTIEMTILPRTHAGELESRSILSFSGRLVLKQYHHRLIWVRMNPGEVPETESVKMDDLPLGKPLQIAVISTGNQLRLFVKGKLIDSHDLEISPSFKLNQLILCQRHAPGVGYGPFDGTIDEMRFSKVARYDADYITTERLTADEQTVALYHCDEGSGDRLKDSSGNGHHVQLEDAKWVAVDRGTLPPAIAPPDSGLSFAPPNARVEVSKPWPLREDEPVTLEAWVTLHHGANGKIVDWFNDNRLSLGVAFRERDNQNYLYLNHYSNGTECNVVTQDTVHGKPTHIVGVWNEKQSQIYVDGQLKRSSDKLVNSKPTIRSKTGEFFIGGAPTDGESTEGVQANWNSFEGVIHQLRVTKGDRYQGKAFEPKDNLLADDNTLALYKFDEREGDILKDSSGNGHDGKIIGAKWVKLGGATPVTKAAARGDARPPAVAPFDEAQAKAHQKTWADHLRLPVEKDVELPGGAKMVFMLIPLGEFLMGSGGDLKID
uniref:LamG-like jellyroll fold domain-containing protein n=1 Tax=Thalassoglobus sp. TaxID=2795869 RepID=UPI003AA8C6FC